MRVDGTIPVMPNASSVQQSVAAVHTPVTHADIRTAIGRAYHALNGRAPSAATLDILTAQASVETGNGAKMMNFNFGGIKGKGNHGETAHYMTREVLDGKSVHLQQGFRSYRSLDEGAIDYVSTLQNRFSGAMKAAETGSVDAFAGQLKTAGYYTASQAEYTSALKNFSPGLGASSEASTPTSSGLPAAAANGSVNFSTADTLARVMDAVSMSIGRIAAPVDTES